MAKLSPDGTLSLSSFEVHDLRATVYEYGRCVKTYGTGSKEACDTMRAIRATLVTIEEDE